MHIISKFEQTCAQADTDLHPFHMVILSSLHNLTFNRRDRRISAAMGSTVEQTHAENSRPADDEPAATSRLDAATTTTSSDVNSVEAQTSKDSVSDEVPRRKYTCMCECVCVFFFCMRLANNQ